MEKKENYINKKQLMEMDLAAFCRSHLVPNQFIIAIQTKDTTMKYESYDDIKIQLVDALYEFLTQFLTAQSWSAPAEFTVIDSKEIRFEYFWKGYFAEDGMIKKTVMIFGMDLTATTPILVNIFNALTNKKTCKTAETRQRLVIDLLNLLK